MLEETGFVDIEVGEPVDTFGGANGEPNARRFDVYAFTFRATRP